MKEALLYIDNAINMLRRSAGPPNVLSMLEDVHASLMHVIFGASLAPAQHHVLADWQNSDWTLGPDEPMPHHGEVYLSMRTGITWRCKRPDQHPDHGARAGQ